MGVSGLLILETSVTSGFGKSGSVLLQHGRFTLSGPDFTHLYQELSILPDQSANNRSLPGFSMHGVRGATRAVFFQF